MTPSEHLTYQRRITECQNKLVELAHAIAPTHARAVAQALQDMAVQLNHWLDLKYMQEVRQVQATDSEEGHYQ